MLPRSKKKVRLASVVLLLWGICAPTASAATSASATDEEAATVGSSGARTAQPLPTAMSIAVFRIDPLGIDTEKAYRLEALFRHELQLLAGRSLPSPAQVERVVAKDPSLRGCTGETDCLAAIGKKLGVKLVVAGNLGELGDSYVVNLKLVDTEKRTEVRRVSEPLSGSPDELIEAVRVAAYRLVAPGQIYGSVAILSDVGGAHVFIDGAHAGKTPLAYPIGGIVIGTHELRLRAPGHSEFSSKVEVRFQKTSLVVVRMMASPEAVNPPVQAVGDARPKPKPRPAPVPWYSSTVGWVLMGAAAIGIGSVVGLTLTPDEIVRCDEDQTRCGIR
ncbi:MAG: PEGA domain-containing protein [Pseudomonadota bacterium]